MTSGVSGARPLGLDAAHDPVDRVRGAEHHAGANALLRARPDHARRRDELRRRQLRRPRVASPPTSCTPGAITPPRKTPSAVMQSNVVAVPMSTTIASRAIEPARGERVDQAVRADGERLVDVERDRQRRRARRRSAAAPTAKYVWHASASGAVTRGTTEPIATLVDDVRREVRAPASSDAKQHAEFVGRARDVGHDAPVRRAAPPR